MLAGKRSQKSAVITATWSRTERTPSRCGQSEAAASFRRAGRNSAMLLLAVRIDLHETIFRAELNPRYIRLLAVLQHGPAIKKFSP